MPLDKAGLRGKKPKQRTVRLKTLDDDVILRELPLSERLRCNKLFQGVAEGDAEASYRAALAQVASALCNPDGSAMYAPEDVEGAAAELLELPGAVADELIAECAVTQGVPREQVTGALGNSEGTPT